MCEYKAQAGVVITAKCGEGVCLVFVLQQRRDTEGWYLRKQRGAAWKTNGKVLDRTRRASGSKRDEGLEEEGRWAGHRRGWMEGCWEVTSEVLSGQREGWGQGSLRDPQPFMVELCPPDRNAQVLTPDTCQCDLLGKRVFADIIKLR